MRRRLLIAVLLAGALVPLAAAQPGPPIVTVPPDTTVEATGPTGATVTYTASATAFNGQSIPVTCDRPSGSTFAIGTATVTCSATHGGQTTTRTFRITVADTTAPVVRVPEDKRLVTRSRSGVTVSYSATATDVVDGAIPPRCTPGSGSVFPNGTSVVVCTAADRAGNTASARFAITVTVVRTVRRTTRALFAPAPRAIVSGPTMLAWRAVPRARFYNVQVYRNGRKVLSRWPLRPRFLLRRSWRHEGRTFRLRAGVYTWFVWPAYGTKANPRYGKLLGQSSFRVVS
jgi:hypothetical protein